MTLPSETTSPARPAETDSDDLGLGDVVVQRAKGRFLNRDGTPGVRKYGLGRHFWSRLYLRALAAPWVHFFGWTIALILLANGLFAVAFASLGAGSIAGTDAMDIADPFLRALFFSMGIFTGVGTGPMHAVGVTANWLTAFESLAGVLSIVTVIGLMLARMTRPRAQIRYTQSAVIAPYEGGRGWMFRMVNTAPGELFEVKIRVTLTMFGLVDGEMVRDFYPLDLERNSVEFFPLHWTVVHPITADSPLANITPERLREGKAEFLILTTALEDTFSTRVTSRTSYLWDDVRWDAKFASIFVESPDGIVTIDAERLDRMDRLAEGATRTPAPLESRS
ncbi:MAG: transporter [Gemmatimonadota bacterium]